MNQLPLTALRAFEKVAEHLSFTRAAESLYVSQSAVSQQIAQLEELDPSTVNELLRLTLLDPSLVMDILEGKQKQQINMMWFTRNALPDLWHEQFPLAQ